MRVSESLPKRAPGARPLSLAIGVFDGLHLGHQAVIQDAVRQARAKHWTAAVLTFDPPPEVALGLPAPLRLGHPKEAEALLAAWGVQELYRVPFTRALARLSAEAFAKKILFKRLRCAAVSVGRAFHFGTGAKAGLAHLQALGAELGFLVHGSALVQQGGHLASSTRLRHAVQEGRLKECERLLGRPWRLRGQVVRGQGLGRQLGFATANLASPQDVLPPRGVWAGRCRVLKTRGAAGPWRRFAANIGVRPTLGMGLAPSVELHLLGFHGTLLGREVEAEFKTRLRAERRFPNKEALQAQIARDVARARRLSDF